MHISRATLFSSFFTLVFFRIDTIPVDRASGTENHLKEDKAPVSGQVNGSSDTLSYTEANPETDYELLEMDMAVVEGDILMSDEKNAVDSIWKVKNGMVFLFYVISAGLDNKKQDILSGLDMISRKACISFNERTVEPDYLVFRPGRGCASYVGFRGGAQPIFISRYCRPGNVAHEVLHALGFHHEHMRADRDEHITIVYENIIEGKEKNFAKKRGNTLGLPYDAGSILHYGAKYFSRNGKPTIITTNREDIGQRKHLSELDIQKVQRLYECDLMRDEPLGVLPSGKHSHIKLEKVTALGRHIPENQIDSGRPGSADSCSRAALLESEASSNTRNFTQGILVPEVPVRVESPVPVESTPSALRGLS